MQREKPTWPWWVFIIAIMTTVYLMPYAKADPVDQRREEIRALQDQANALKDIARTLDRIVSDCKK